MFKHFGNPDSLIVMLVYTLVVTVIAVAVRIGKAEEEIKGKPFKKHFS